MSNNHILFTFLKIIAWIIFVGLSIEAGGLLVNFVFSIYRPDFVENLYQKLDLSDLYSRSQWLFYVMYGFILLIALLKALLFYTVIMLVTKLDLLKPFNNFAATKITFISYYTLVIGVLSYIARETTKSLLHRGYEINNLDQFWADSQAFILMAAIIYVIATIFARGVEIQMENDLTV